MKINYQKKETAIHQGFDHKTKQSVSIPASFDQFMKSHECPYLKSLKNTK